MSSESPYLGAFWRHPTNRVALLAAGCAAIFASIPYGWTGLALVGVLAVGTEILAALAIPSLPSFRARVDRDRHVQARLQRQSRLLAELNNHGDDKALATFRHMSGRVQALYQAVGDSRNTLTRADVDKLEDMLVDYLGLCVVWQSLKPRRDAASDDVLMKRIAALQLQLQDPALAAEEARPLRSALAEYTEAANRSRRLAVRRSALEATLISMPDKLEEVYQLVISSPYSSGMDGKLEESLARLRIAEEVAAEFGAAGSLDLDRPAAARPDASDQAARQASRARSSQAFIRK